jgi:hypothetical protein
MSSIAALNASTQRSVSSSTNVSTATTHSRQALRVARIAIASGG